MHQEGIKYALQVEGEDGPELPPHLGYLEVLQEFSLRLNAADAAQIHEYLVKKADDLQPSNSQALAWTPLEDMKKMLERISGGRREGRRASRKDVRVNDEDIENTPDGDDSMAGSQPGSPQADEAKGDGPSTAKGKKKGRKAGKQRVERDTETEEPQEEEGDDDGWLSKPTKSTKKSKAKTSTRKPAKKKSKEASEDADTPASERIQRSRRATASQKSMAEPGSSDEDEELENPFARA
eukprot:comp24106_c1_seq2/m.43595 comp24106_c1_seq2/g.43595  ORF comp24106_c1_seq2/g.43595 comp24106_c1_seq2/m.43595 type:complete len:238 (-) comp24106_c1_seq2:643-1356(-)